MLFEKVLRRLCPCYYARSDESQVLCSTYEEHKEHSSENPQNTGRFTEATVNYRPTCGGDCGNECFRAVDYWGGSFDLIHPQPLYAMPSEKNELAAESKCLLRPPLYWKKTMKNFGSKGPPVIQECNTKKMCVYHQREVTSLERCQNLALKHSETVADVRSVTSEHKKVYWLRSQSLHDLPLDACFSCGNNGEFLSRNEYGEDGRKRNECGTFKYKHFPRTDTKVGCEKYPGDSNRDVKKFRVIPDISYGVIVFSAAYHSGKKLLLLKIDRLENLSLKGREGHAYSAIIKLSVSPSDKYIKCTKVLKKSTCPEVKEDFSFTVKENSGKILRLSVFDTLSQNPFNAIGHALLSLDGVMSRHPKKFRMKLYRHTQPHITPGNLALSLGYRPEEDKFTLVVEKAKNLILQKDKNVKLNTYVKATLYSHGNKLKSKKSHLIANSKDPKYNSKFTFRVKEDDVDDLLMIMSVRLKSFVKDATIGRVILGPFFITDQKKLTPWGRVFLKRELVSHWFRLYL